MKNYWSIYVLTFLLLTSCGGSTSTEEPESKVLAPVEFAKVIEDSEVMLIDVRTPQEYEQGFIEGAVNIDIKADDFEKKIKHFDRDIPIAVYCAKGGRSGKAAEVFKKLGFQKVYDLEGGYTEWTKQP